MSRIARSPVAALKIAFWRLHQWLGVPGLFGMLLLALAGVTLAQAWRGTQRAYAAVPAASPVLRAAALPHDGGVNASASVQLPTADAVPLLLTRIQRTAAGQGLGWPRADYRVSVANGESPASLQVKCALEGPYPSIRRFITELLHDTPSLTLSEFSVSRPSAEAANVQAKLTVIVYLAGAVAGAQP